MNENNKNKSMKKTKTSTLKIVILCAVCVILVAVIGLLVFLLRSATTPPDVDSGSIYTGTGTGTGDLPDHPEIKRRDGVYNFLVLGKDKVGFNTDVIMIVNYDVNAQKASIMQIPRDTYFRYNGRGIKVNSLLARLYSAARSENAKDPLHTALEKYMDVLEKGLNIRLDFYAVVDLSGFVSIVNRIGGVTLNVPADMDYDDPAQGLSIHLKAGMQTLTGEQSEQFIRFRSGYALADIARTDAQKIFMSALIRQLKTNMTVSAIPGLMQDLYKYVDTSVSLSDCIYFAKQALSMDMSNISMMTMQGGAYKGGMYYVMYRDTMYKVINSYFNVYDGDILDSYFDIDRLFTDTDNEAIQEIYMTKTDHDFIKDAEDIDENGLPIQRIPSKNK